MLGTSNVNSPMFFDRSGTLAISTVPKSSWNADKVRNATDSDWLLIISFAAMFSRLALNDAECTFCKSYLVDPAREVLRAYSSSAWANILLVIERNEIRFTR